MTPAIDIIQKIADHAAADYPRECCGVIVVTKGKQRYFACRNISDQPTNFVIDPADYAAAEDTGEVLMIVHSHPDMAAVPSQADLVGMEKSGMPWLIMNWPTGAFGVFTPSGYVAPLVGREFVHGVLDCYSLIRDYYQQALGISLKDYPRQYEWWLKGDDLYRQLFGDAGFVAVDAGQLQAHDVIFMRIASPVDNHGAVYLGDDVVLQHVTGRLSSRDVYGGWWRKITTGVVRHKDLL